MSTQFRRSHWMVFDSVSILLLAVAVLRGRTRTLVERFERKEKLNSNEVLASDTTPCIIPETAKVASVLVGCFWSLYHLIGLIYFLCYIDVFGCIL